ncbi:hypothetical protein [Aeromicrobium sp. Root472D3]|uniref:hypothetical protein n=1 Tax=Aeromicrobium sp. Root472D3 TaxID=1736540 RepID=UPI0006FB4BF5|nr:hypothetical protein [Aeromicrobium sp. Root472D3]KQX75934.1 hypothetical protein ASD10_12570 [Aeromicrobium sp. Root472D3]
MTTLIRPREIVSLVLGLVLVVAMVATGDGSASADGTDEVGAFSQSKTVTRQLTQDDGAVETIDSRDVTLKVDHTLNLRGRERVAISWTGAHPSGGRASDPYGENGLKQEYPMVIMQCRGRDDPSLPKAQQLDPTTCWTSTRQQRSQSIDGSDAVWRHDLHATEEERALKTGLDPIPEACQDVPSDSTHLTPFVAANGKVYSACNSETMPPEAAVGAAFPPAEVAAFTDTDGNGSVNYEVRSATENESLGCTTATPCSIVAVPIMGISCVDGNTQCQATGRFRPGASNFASEGVDAAVSPVYWWSASNWRNRITVPITFGLPPDACDVLDSRAPTAFYGSELMSQASLQWAPAYCLNTKRFKFQHNRMGDEPAFTLVENGTAPAAFVSGTREADGDEPIGYAPTAVTGFAIAFIVDEPDNKGERSTLNLTPRLLAKLLSQSYAGSTRGQQHPGMEKNPLSMNQDPEFQQLNPGLDSIAREAAATVLSLSESSDVLTSLTSYIRDDPDAKAFMAGKADPWGMVVNPSYKNLKLPVSSVPLLDTFVPTSQQECQQQNTTPYLTQIAAPVTSISKIAQAVLDGWPNVQTRAERSSSSDPCKFGRIDRQGVGSRFMLGIVSLGDAERYGLRTAALRTGSGAARQFVAPSDASIAAAVKVAKADGVRKAFALSQATIRKTKGAYPGAMIVYTVAKLRGLDAADAKTVASFIRIATSEGQVRGSGNGRLPDGFVPITKKGATSALYAQAQKVASLIEAQKEPKAAPTTSTPTKGAPAAGGSAPASGAEVPDAPDAATATPAATTTPTTDVIATASNSSRPAQSLLPVLVALLLLAGLGGPGTRLVAEWRRRR